MNKELLSKFYEISEEEKNIINGSPIEKGLYTSDLSFNIQGKKLLNDLPILIRTHTRFCDFPLHSHDYLEMMYVLDGTIHHSLNHDELSLKKGDLLIMNRYSEHSIKKCTRDDIGINFIISDSLLSSIMENIPRGETLYNLLESNMSKKRNPGYLLFHTEGNVPIENILTSIMYSMANEEMDFQILSTSISLLFSYLSYYKTSIYDYEADQTKEERLRKMVVKYIRTHLNDANLSELSSQLGFSLEYTSRKIKQWFQKGFKELVVDERLLKASNLLRDTDLSVGEIINQIGYENKSYFFKEFKTRYGITPHKWRNS